MGSSDEDEIVLSATQDLDVKAGSVSALNSRRNASYFSVQCYSTKILEFIDGAA